MPYNDPLLDLSGFDPEEQKEIARIMALRGDPTKAARLQRLGAAAALASDEGLKGFGDQLYRTGAAQEDRYREGMAGAVEGLKQSRARAKERAEEQAWREQQRADQLAYQKQQMGLQWAQEQRARAAAEQGQWDVVADPVRGGFVRINKRTGEMQPVNMPGQGDAPDTSGLPPSGLPVTQPGGKPPTEAESKTGFRAGVGVNALTQLASGDQKNLTPGVAESAATFFGLPAAQQTAVAGMFGGPERLLARGAQDQFVDQALTEMTGAAYTEQQINAFRSAFLPTIFDDEKSKAAKVERAYNFVRSQAQAAGRAWTPERDMQFRLMMQSIAQPGAQAPAQGAQPGMGQQPSGRNFEAEYGLGGQ